MRKLIFLCLFLLIGCQSINEGTVTDKRFVASHTETVIEPDYGQFGISMGNCKMVTHYYPDSYELKINSNWVSVDQNSYNSYQIGSHWVRQ